MVQVTSYRGLETPFEYLWLLADDVLVWHKADVSIAYVCEEDVYKRQALGSDEDAVTYDDIFPKRTGTVTALVVDDINSFSDDTMDFDLNEKDDKGTKLSLIHI